MAAFTEFFTQLRSSLDQAHQDRQQFYRQTRAHVQQMAQQVRHDLAAVSADLQAASKAFRGR